MQKEFKGVNFDREKEVTLAQHNQRILAIHIEYTVLLCCMLNNNIDIFSDR